MKNKYYIWICFFLVSLFVLASIPTRSERYGAGGFLAEYDRLGYYSYMPSFVSLDYNYDTQIKTFREHFDSEKITKKTNNKWTCGAAILWLPFFLLAHFIAYIFNLNMNGYSTLYQTFVVIGSLFWFFLGLVIFEKILSKNMQKQKALIGVALLGGATFFLNYVLYEQIMSHTASMFAACLYLFALTRVQKRFKFSDCLAAFFSLGLMILIRPQNCVLGLFILYFVSEKSRTIKQLLFMLSGGVVAAIMFIPQMLIWHCQTGRFLTIPQGRGFMLWSEPRFFEVLFSSYHGLFYWHSIFLFAVAAVVYLTIKEKKSIWILTAIIFIIMTYINSCVRDWWGGVGFGGRRFDALAPFLIYALMMTMKKVSVRVLFWLSFVFIGVNILVFVIYLFNLSPEYFPLYIQGFKR